MAALAECTGRPVDLIDLQTTGEPLLGQILKHGKRLLGEDALYAELIKRHVFAEADFMPYYRRILMERGGTVVTVEPKSCYVCNSWPVSCAKNASTSLPRISVCSEDCWTLEQVTKS